jgi:hypothetical protein
VVATRYVKHEFSFWPGIQIKAVRISGAPLSEPFVSVSILFLIELANHRANLLCSRACETGLYPCVGASQRLSGRPNRSPRNRTRAQLTDVGHPSVSSLDIVRHGHTLRAS